MIKVAINGWGRIGRILFRAALRDSSDIDFVAINSRAAVHGVLDEEVSADREKNTMVVN